MSFNEENSVEHYVVNELSGVNLNQSSLTDNATFQWKYIDASSINRDTTDIFIISELKEALCRLNPAIEDNPELAEQVIHKLRGIVYEKVRVGLVKANEEFLQWLKGDKTLPFGENNRHIPIKLIDFDNLENNKYQITTQFVITDKENKRPDIVMFINGIPVVVGEVKTVTRPSISWVDGAHEIHDIYEEAVPQLFVPNILSFATEGKELYYGAVRTPLEFWSPWRMENNDAEIARKIGLSEVGDEVTDLLSPKRLLDILQNFSVFATKGSKSIKIICRYQQYAGTNQIVQRVKEGKIKKGLIWHFQGSGKSLLMLFAAQKLRRDQSLNAPTVLIVVDRTDLDSQISGTFSASNVSNVVSTDSIKELHELLEHDTRKIIITMVHKFKDAYANMNNRDNIIVLVDEAHRTQEGDLGRMMRASLPNAFLFGLTGTPVNKADKNTFWAFGAESDSGGYMSRYTFQDSIRDKATLPLHFEPRLVDVHIDKDKIDDAFRDLQSQHGLSDEEADALSRKAAKMSAFLKSPERVEMIVDDIVEHYSEKVEPHGFKAMIVTPDRHACVQYKQELDKHYTENASSIVMSTTANDPFEFKLKWGIDKSQQAKIIEKFNEKDSELKFIIVTAKLLTGFDAPILQTMYLDKSLKDHTLLQAICRTNRLYPNKHFGRIVDYFGIFDDAAKALEFDEDSVKKVITNLTLLKEQISEAMENCLRHFPGVDRMVEGFEGLEAAQQCINTNEKKDKFAIDYKFLSKLWESLSPDSILNDYQSDYIWLTGVYNSTRNSIDNIGKLLWHSLGAQTTKLIHDNIHVSGLNDDMSEFVLDADVIDDIFNNPDKKQIKVLEKELIKRFKKHATLPKFKDLSKRLEDLKEKAEQGLIQSIEFVKELCKIAQETVEAEKKLFEQKEKSPKAALTELFLEIKTDSTPAVIESIVNDIDAIVRAVSFEGWQNSISGQKEVKSGLRKTLWIKYKIKDNELFEKAYAYIREFY
tara:strand:- start:3259 stop:6213 length:2955 start_codon:yes stop_codon:yes gene_type:complete